MSYRVFITPASIHGFPLDVFRGEDKDLAVRVFDAYIKSGEHPRLCELSDKTTRSEKGYGTDFRVIDIDRKKVSRATEFAKDGRPLTRRELYAGREGVAECEYAHEFMCGGFPTEDTPDRPSKDEWMNATPHPFEVDEYLSEKLFG